MSGILGVRSFGELADFRNGLNYAADCRVGGELAVIGVGDFQKNERISSFGHLEHITPERALGGDDLLKSGDLVFVRSNGNKALVGRCMKVEDVSEPLTHSGFTIRARLKPEAVDPEWILQFFVSGLASRAISRLGRGTNISNLSQAMLQRLDIPIPSTNHCARTLAICEKLLGCIEKLDELYEYKKAWRCGFAQQLLTGKKRFPAFRHLHDRQEGEFATLPSDWQVKPIAEIASEVSGRGATAGAVVYSCTKHDGLVPSLDYFGKQVFSRNLDTYKRLAPGDFAYATNHIEEGSIGLLHEGYAHGLVSPMYTVFRCHDDINPEFMFAVLKTENYRRVFERRTSASVNRRGSLRWKEFSKIRVPIPSRVEQDRIVEVLGMVDAEIALLNEQRQQYDLYKRGLMQRMLSGEVQVPA